MVRKILYIRPEDSSGTLPIWKRAHESLGNECRTVTLFPNATHSEEDICLTLPFIPKKSKAVALRNWLQNKYREGGIRYQKEGYPPTWSPSNWFETIFYKTRERIWTPIINHAIEKYDLEDFDIYHIESGRAFYFDGRFVVKMHERGKHIWCNYHGTDLRTRGVLPNVDAVSEVNTTSEVDLLYKHPNIEYLFLPLETEKFTPNFQVHDPIRICHATRDRAARGTDQIIEVCRRLEQEFPVEFTLLENLPHNEFLARLAEQDIFIDLLIEGHAGYGYGMAGIEAMCYGLIPATNLPPQQEELLGDHPFVKITPDTLYVQLTDLLRTGNLADHKRKSRDWVVQYHDVNRVIQTVYRIYRREGWIDTVPWDNDL